jgi:3-phenylpropionate/trans-cinnamate dioxygenase ferredoxin subunit
MADGAGLLALQVPCGMALSDNIRWVKVAESRAELFDREGMLKEVEAEGKDLCLAWVKGVIRACAYQCPHAGARMSDGYVDAQGHIVCPLHRYRFSLENGRNVSGEGYFLKTFPVDERADGIYVGLPEKKGLFGV